MNMRNVPNISRFLSNYRKHNENMILTYIFLTLVHCITCSIISLNGYLTKHVELSIIMIVMNIVNLLYYLLIKNSIQKIYGEHNHGEMVRMHLKRISYSTYLDIMLNILVFVTVTLLFSIWVGNKYNTDRSLLIFEYVLNTIVNLVSFSLCIKNLFDLRNLFNIKNYTKTEVVESPMIEV